ncbi:MAG TPA: hypothetical protein VGB50_07300 [Flavobacterium sp.]|jgi:hypothetical protein
MKKIFYSILSLMVLFACESNKKATITEEGTEVVKARTPVEDTINKQAVPDEQVRTVEGTVSEIKNGKDGYTAKIATADDETYFVTVSHSNLKDPKQFRAVKEGEKVKVAGDYWKLENDNQITVREMY